MGLNLASLIRQKIKEMTIKKTTVVFVHGWAVGPFVFKELASYLSEANIIYFDLGFYGPTSLPEVVADGPVIAVGYSLGFPWLLHHRPFHWDALVSISSFARFTRADDFKMGMSPRLLHAMKTRLHNDPKGLMQDIYQVCGITHPPTGQLEIARLEQGLDWLEHWDERAVLQAQTCPILALAAHDDLVVPDILTTEAFAPFPHIPLHWSPDGGGHGLPITRAAWCAREILGFISSLAPCGRG